MPKKPLQVYLDRTDRALLDRLARRLGLSRAEALRAAVRRWAMDLSAQDDPLLALIGCVDDPELPADLSTRADEYAVAGYPKRRVAEE
ncbi:MAG: CopG family transcriptional regulator [Gemmatimonadales bacterium]